MKTRHLVLVAALGWLAAGCAHTAEEARTTTTTVPATGGERVVITERPADPAATVRGEVRHSVRGRITDIDLDDGTVKVRMPDGSKYELPIPPVAAASIREGDPVAIEFIVNPR